MYFKGVFLVVEHVVIHVIIKELHWKWFYVKVFANKENELNPAEVFVLRLDCSRQEEIFSISTEPSQSSEVISFD